MRCFGTVKWFDDKKGYGFIVHPDGDVFVHYSAIVQEGYRTLAEGQGVDYELTRGEKGLGSRDVHPLDLSPLDVGSAPRLV